MNNYDINLVNLNNKIEKNIYFNYWLKSPDQKPHYHPDYVCLIKNRDEIPSAIICNKNDDVVIYPFVYKNLSDLKFLPIELRSYKEIISPYGYGGPIYIGKNKIENLRDSFINIYNKFLYENNFITEFIREDIFNDNLIILDGQRKEQQKNVVVRLDRDDEKIWMDYEHKVRKNVKRAKREKLKYIIDENFVYFNDFLKIYYSVMKKTDASQFFFFTKEIFKRLIGSLKKTFSISLVHVCDKDKVLSTELILLSKTSLYSFLGGTSIEGRKKRANDFLKHKSILWGKELGKKYYVLGGGAKPNDGIFRFKKSFDPYNLTPFNINKRVINKSVYERIMSIYKKKIKDHTESNFFPPYRE